MYLQTGSYNTPSFSFVKFPRINCDSPERWQAPASRIGSPNKSCCVMEYLQSYRNVFKVNDCIPAMELYVEKQTVTFSCHDSAVPPLFWRTSSRCALLWADHPVRLMAYAYSSQFLKLWQDRILDIINILSMLMEIVYSSKCTHLIYSIKELYGTLTVN